MPQKLDIEYVKDFVCKKTNGSCEVLSEEYINNRTPLAIRCSCGNIFYRQFCKLRSREIQCIDCKNKKASERYRLDTEYVISQINSNGCEYISGVYENQNSLLTIKCNCGKIFKKSYVKFSSGQNRCPDCGNKALRQSKIKYTIDDVKNELESKGYRILDENLYVDSITPFECVCKRGHHVNIKFIYFLNGKSGCKKCADIEKGSINHWNYDNGNSKVLEALRHSIYFWRKEVRAKYGNKCLVTGASKNVIVHHLVDFKTILDESSKELGIPVHEYIGEYKNYDDFVSLKNRVIEKHTTSIGIPITRKVHVQFHTKHKGECVTPKMFLDFAEEYYGVLLQKIVSDDKLSS